MCSPGLDRHLKSDNEFLWAVGKEIEIRTHQPIDDKNNFVGELLGIDGKGSITIREEGADISIQRDNIAKAHLKVTL